MESDPVAAAIDILKQHAAGPLADHKIAFVTNVVVLVPEDNAPPAIGVHLTVQCSCEDSEPSHVLLTPNQCVGFAKVLLDAWRDSQFAQNELNKGNIPKL